MKRVLILFALLLCQWSWAVPIRTIREVNIRVELNRDGSAWICQRWDVEAGDTGTEFYLPIGNLGPMTISQLQVSENGVPFESMGEDWDVDRNRRWKTGKCGIVPKRNGVELCWGLGEEGNHLWEVRYFVTGLVQAYNEADGFNFQFVNKGMEPAPKQACVTIVPAFECPTWTYDNTRAWAFGFYGDINVDNGAVVAKTSTAMSYDSSIIALVKFQKGLFSPAVVNGGSFQRLLDRALEGSSYGEDEDGEEGKFFFAAFALLFFGGFALLIGIGIASTLGYKWKKSFFGKSKIHEWYRDVPLEGDLFAAHYALTKGHRFGFGSGEANRLIGAFFLRWIMKGQVGVQPDPSSSKRVNLLFQAESVSEDPVEEALYQMARRAAGSNLILEKGEFEKWSTDHYKKMMAWPERAIAHGKEWFHQKGYLVKSTTCTPEAQVEACHVIEFQNYLKDFTLSDQREAVEVGLWKEYLVYAQLFGIAEKVAKQFKKLYPAQFEELAQSTGMNPTTLYYTMHWASRTSTRAFTNAVSKAGNINGTGGHSSFGGGGGFSGGGFGGGGR